jgi:hypothetical protein
VFLNTGKWAQAAECARRSGSGGNVFPSESFLEAFALFKLGRCEQLLPPLVLAAVHSPRAARMLVGLRAAETMSRRHELAMDSYDRFFPNQDTMPSGGFGNLIALPLQREPRLAGNTAFLDEAFKPFADQ